MARTLGKLIRERRGEAPLNVDDGRQQVLYRYYDPKRGELGQLKMLEPQLMLIGQDDFLCSTV